MPRARKEPDWRDCTWVTPQQVMAYLQISRATLHRRVVGGDLTPMRRGRVIRFRRTDVEHWAETGVRLFGQRRTRLKIARAAV